MKKPANEALGVALAVLVGVTHYAYAPLAQWLYADDPIRAGRALFYILRGFEGTALFVVVWSLAPRSLPVLAACLWGAAESAQTALCRVALGIGGPAPVPAPYAGLCDIAAGAPVGLIVTLLGLVCIAVVREASDVRRTTRE